MHQPLQYQFDFSGYVRRKSADQQKFEANNMEMLETFMNVAHQAFIETRALVNQIPPIQRSRKLKPTTMNGMICGKMISLFPEKSGWQPFGRAAYKADGVLCFFKKLNSKHKPGHVLTKNSAALMNNIRNPRAGDGNESIIWLGYTVDEGWNMITGLYAVHIVDNVIQWKTDIYDLFHNGTADNTVTVPVEPITPIKPTLKGNDSERKAQ